MNDSSTEPELKHWLVQRGLAGDTVEQLVLGLWQRLEAGGLPILRTFVGLQTLHPLYGGFAYVWRQGEATLSSESYLRQRSVNPDFLSSPFHHMQQNKLLQLRQKLEGPLKPGEAEFDIYDTFRAEGGTDYLVHLFPFARPDGAAFLRPDGVGWNDGILISLLCNRPGGFTETEIKELEATLMVFALAARSSATYGTALSVVSTYLGRDAGQRVMDGNIDRGTASSMRAVIYFADLQGFTPLSEKLPGPELLSMLDDYLNAISRGVLQRGGEVLKFLGDGVLAVFEIADDDTDCQIACGMGIGAGQDAFAAVAALNQARTAMNLPTMELDLAMHIGDVLYGNVGAEGRLDFTVIGPAVNEASRIEAMCGELDRNWLVSETFYQSARHCSIQLEAMGRHQLRGLTGQRALYSVPHK